MRLDLALVARGCARSRNHAATLISEGRVSVDGRVATKASQQVDDAAVLTADAEKWVSRAAHKLLGALAESGVAVPARVLDAGASTGGFTQVCLEHGAERVYSVDVGHDQLASPVREDPRVRNLEGLNLRDLTLDHLDGEQVDLIVGDVSFISLRILLPHLVPVLAPHGQALLLVKPQFEVGKGRLGPGGVVKDPRLRTRAVDDVVAAAADLGWRELWRGTSQLRGSAGNVEFFVRLCA